MNHFSCVIQDLSAAQRSSDVLERRLADHHASHYPGEQTSVSWRAIPEGYMFTEGRQSTSSLVVCVIDHETSFVERERYMRGVCDVWTDVTGCTDHEIVVVVSENQPEAAR